GVLVQRVLHLGGVDVLPAAQDQVRAARGDGQIPLLVEHADVTGGQPTVGVAGRRGGFGAVPVAGHHGRPAHADLALLAGAASAAVVLAADGDLDVDDRRAHGVGALGQVGGGGEHRGGGAFGLPVVGAERVGHGRDLLAQL